MKRFMASISYKISQFISYILICVFICNFLALPVLAEPSSYRASLTSQSLEKGFGQSSVELLSSVPEKGKTVVAEQLLSSLKAGRLGVSANDLKKSSDEQRVLSYVGDNSSLDIYADGSKFRFRGDIDNVKGTRAIVNNKLKQEELESLGRDFIAKNLSNFVALGQNEKLTFLGTRYLRNASADLKGQTKDEIVANIAIFGREVQNNPIIGSGSKIAIWYGGDKQPVGFDVDWTKYKLTTQKQDILPVERLKNRIEAVSAVPKDASDIKLSRFECGYVDLGATKRSKTLQAGCLVAYDGYTGAANQKLRWAKIEFVPAGSKIIPDANWPITRLITTQGEPKPGQPKLEIPTRSKDPGVEATN